MNTHSEDSRLDSLLSRWEELRRAGKHTTAAELCADCPELGPEVQRRIQAVLFVENLLPPTPLEPANGTCSEVPPVPGRERDIETLPETARPPFPVVIEGYELLEQLGVGGMGVVYKARQAGLNRLVALKMILAGQHATDELRARFRAEAEAVARLEHPNIVSVHATGEQDGLPFLVMQLLEGGSLAKKLKLGALGQEEAARLVRDLAHAVESAHLKGVVHRDLKPANVLFSSQGTAKITDFGLAKLLDLPDGLTGSHAVMGTPGYLAPEQASGKSGEAGPPADVYALGAVLYQCLTGVAPFHGLKGMDALKATLEAEPAPPSRHRAGIAPDLEAVCLKCLAKDPRQRYPSAQALADDLGRWLNHEPTRARPAGPLARLGRGLSRRPRLLAAGGLAAFLALAVPLAVSRLDPQRPVRDMQRQLADGRATDLLGDDGLPRWRRWGVADGGLRGDRPSRELAFQSFRLSLLELLPSTGRDRYRFRVNVRQDEGKEGDIGLFFALRRFPTAQGEVLFFCSLTFNDLDERGPTGLVALNLRASSEAAPGAETLRISNRVRAGKSFPFLPARREEGLGPWRRLVVEVTDQRIRTYWDGQLAHELTRERLDARLRDWLATQPQLAGLGIRFDPGGGLGLMVDEASAVFSDAVVEPLTPDD